MSDLSRSETSVGDYIRSSPWYPLRKWWYFNQLFNQDAGMTFCWEQMDWRLAALSLWFGFMPTPLFVPFNNGPMNHHAKKTPQWKVRLHMALFSPAEISVNIKDGFLEVKGKHEERPEQHGFTDRCFTRKYRLPMEVDVTKVISTLSVDGILTVEAPLAPAAIVIPIKAENESIREPEKNHQQEHEYPNQVSYKPPTDESSKKVNIDQDQSGSSSAQLYLNEEMKKALTEQTSEDDRPPVDVYDGDIKSLHHPFFGHQDMLEIQEIPKESLESEHNLTVKEREMLEMAGSSAGEPEEQQMEVSESNQ